MKDYIKIFPDDRFYKTWIEDKCWIVTYSFAIPRLTKKGYVGCKWQTERKFKSEEEKEAEENYQEFLQKLEKEYQEKRIAKYNISKSHITLVKINCPKCGKDADIFTFMLCMGGDDYPSCPIACKHCAEDKNNWWDNTVGIYYYKDDTEFAQPKDNEKSFYQDKYIITKEDLTNAKL